MKFGRFAGSDMVMLHLTKSLCHLLRKMPACYLLRNPCTLCASLLILFHPFYLFQIFTCLGPKTRVLVQKYLLKQFFSAMVGARGITWRISVRMSFLQILKQDLVCKIWLLHYLLLQYFLFGLFVLFACLFSILCFVLSLWMMGRPV